MFRSRCGQRQGTVTAASLHQPKLHERDAGRRGIRVPATGRNLLRDMSRSGRTTGTAGSGHSRSFSPRGGCARAAPPLVRSPAYEPTHIPRRFTLASVPTRVENAGSGTVRSSHGGSAWTCHRNSAMPSPPSTSAGNAGTRGNRPGYAHASGSVHLRFLGANPRNLKSQQGGA